MRKRSKRTNSTDCRVCGGRNLVHRFRVRSQDLWKCRDCGFQQVGVLPSAEIFAAIYSESYFTNAKYKGDLTALAKENKRRLTLLRDWIQPGANVLDAGCSTGDFIAHAKDEYKMYGIDYSEFAVSIARQRNPEIGSRIQSGGLEDATWSQRPFDAICLWDVVEHIWNPTPVLSEMLQNVNSGGIIAISTPAIDSAMARVLGPYWPFMTPPEHLSFFSRKAFETCVRSLGNCDIVHFSRKGKWANLAFIAHKVCRIAPSWFPTFFLRPLLMWPLKNLSIYVPTGDIQYVIIRKREA